MNYWPWWAGAIGLALVTIAFTLATDRTLGVSGAWERVLHWREERNRERLEARFADEQVLADALAVATAEEFGTSHPRHAAPDTPASGLPPSSTVTESAPPEAPRAAPQRPSPVVTQAALLVSILLGGLLAAVVSGQFELRLDMGAAFSRIVTDNPVLMTVLLFAGGILVGFGTRLAGGCSSGHGLSGCGRLHPISLLATTVFFGTAVVVSFLLWKVI
ncbi:MAG: YeeE/YedE family protein [Pseudonocardia sp.]|nr:YeeE/YedE family protein [Pseudonocardia sp.]